MSKGTVPALPAECSVCAEMKVVRPGSMAPALSFPSSISSTSPGVNWMTMMSNGCRCEVSRAPGGNDSFIALTRSFASSGVLTMADEGVPGAWARVANGAKTLANSAPTVNRRFRRAAVTRCIDDLLGGCFFYDSKFHRVASLSPLVARRARSQLDPIQRSASRNVQAFTIRITKGEIGCIFREQYLP